MRYACFRYQVLFKSVQSNLNSIQNCENTRKWLNISFALKIKENQEYCDWVICQNIKIVKAFEVSVYVKWYLVLSSQKCIYDKIGKDIQKA